MATAHLIHGYLGAGKSTFARELADRSGAVLLNLDEWYLRLFTSGVPTAQQDYDALGRLRSLLDDHWQSLVAIGVDVVLDFGFWSRAERDDARDRAAVAGAAVVLYWVKVDDATALRRCLSRNESDRASFVIDEATFEFLRSRYQPLDEDEDFTLAEWRS